MDKNTDKDWDKVASYFNDLRVPDWDDDLFLKTIGQLPVWNGDSHILDLGCGAGRYSIAVADRCAHVTGSDISPEMIGFARKKQKEYGKDNISFVTESWHDLDLRSKGYEDKFNLVFGHMTPALESVDDIEKATKASRGFCALATFAKREAPVTNEFLGFMGKDPVLHNDNKITEIFDHLYKQKHYPRVDYYIRDDTQDFDEEGAVEFLKSRMVLDASEEVDEDTIEKIREFVRMKIQDGRFVNVVNSIIVTIVWNAKEDTNGFDKYKR